MKKKYEKEIKDEEEGHELYEALAKKDPKHSKEFTKMAKDEERHEETLKKMNGNMHRSKLKSAAFRALGGKYA